MVRLMDTTQPRCVDENGISRVYIYVYAYVPLIEHACTLKYSRVLARVRFHFLSNAMIASLPPRIGSSDQYL